jgi:putative transposase
LLITRVQAIISTSHLESLYLTQEQREALSQWIQGHPTITLEAVRHYLQEQYGVVYQSKQSYYDLMQAAGWSYHKSEKRNPKRDEALVQERREEIKKNWRNTGSR